MTTHNRTPWANQGWGRWFFLGAAGLLTWGLGSAGAAPLPTDSQGLAFGQFVILAEEKEKPKADQGKNLEQAGQAEEKKGSLKTWVRVTFDPPFDLAGLRQALEKLQQGKLDAKEFQQEIAKILEKLPKPALARQPLELRSKLLKEWRPFGQGRLGVALEKPSPALADQLNLPKNRGLVITDVLKNSPAAKAGLKIHDVLLKVHDQPVPNDVNSFIKILDAIKADAPVTITLIRKGKEESAKGVVLADTKWKRLIPEVPLAKPIFPMPPFPRLPFGGGKGVMTTIMRTGDNFTSRYQEGSLIITVTGKVTDGKASVGEIHVQDGLVTTNYQKVEQVPAPYRDKVNYVVRISTTGQIRIETK